MTVSQDAILDALRCLGIQTAGTFDDPPRWSVSDLATDLAPLLSSPPDSIDEDTYANMF